MRRFDYVRPETLDEAVGFLDEHGEDALVLAGGTAAVVLVSQGVLRPRYMVDLAGIPSLRDVQYRDGSGFRIGALTPIRSLERDPLPAQEFGLLADAASQVANIRVRNVATVGGSICYGEPQTDMPPALIAMGASVTIAGVRGTRTVKLEDFFYGPYETALEMGEVLTEILVPLPDRNSAGCHMKFTVGSPGNKPVANVSTQVLMDSDTGRVADVRIVMGTVGPVPALAAEAAALLRGELPDDNLIGEVAGRASEEADPIDDLRGSIWFKRRIVRVLVERGLRCALQKAKDRHENA